VYPTVEESGMLMSSVPVNVRMCKGVGGEKGAFGVRQRGRKMGQLILNMGLAWAEVHILVQRATTPSNRVFYAF
jgi:hypothetical protein